MTDIRITAMHRTAGKPNRGGTQICAFFDCELPHVALRGCALALKPNGTWIAWTPRLILADDDPSARRAVFFRGTELQRGLTDMALSLYRQLGGRIGLD